jgi:hypothetical protein
MTMALAGLPATTLGRDVGRSAGARLRLLGVAMSVESDDDLLTPSQAGALLGLTRWGINNLADAGKLSYSELPETRPGRRPDRRFRRGDVLALKRIRAVSIPDLLERLDDLEQSRDQHTAEIAHLRRQLADLRGDDAD